MQVIKEEGARPIKAWVGSKVMDLGEAVKAGHSNRTNATLGSDGKIVVTVPDIEAAALKQLKNLARLPFIHSNGVAVMPDVQSAPANSASMPRLGPNGGVPYNEQLALARRWDQAVDAGSPISAQRNRGN